MYIQNLVEFCPSILKILSKNQFLISIKGRVSIANLRKMTIYNTNLDLVHDNVYTKFGWILSIGGPRGRVVKVADSLSPLTIRSSHRCDWCGFEPHTGHKWDKSSSTCACVRWFFPGYSRFRPTFWLARLDMSEIILKGTLNWTKKKKRILSIHSQDIDQKTILTSIKGCNSVANL